MTDKDRVVRALNDADWRLINTLGNRAFDPRSHGFVAGAPGSNHCRVCLMPRGQHESWLRRLVVRVFQWRK